MDHLAFSSQRIATERVGRVLVVRFGNPPYHLFDERTNIEFAELMRRLSRDRSVGAVVLTGQADTLTHLDVRDVLEAVRLLPPLGYRSARAVAAAASLASGFRPVDRLLRGTPLRGAMLLPRVYGALRRITEMDKPVIAALNGTAVALGCVIALACDTRVAADGDYAIGLPESVAGILAGGGGTQQLIRTVGRAKALEMLLTGRLMTPREALAAGLVDRVVPPEELERTALAVAAELASRSPVVVRELKRLARHTQHKPAGAAMRMEAAGFIAAVTQPGTRVALAAMDSALRAAGAPPGRARKPRGGRTGEDIMREKTWKLLLLLLAAQFLLQGAWAAFDADGFSRTVADYGATNEHLVHDYAAASTTFGAALVRAVFQTRWRTPALATSAIWSALHGLSHIIDIAKPRHALTGPLEAILLVLSTAVFAALVAASARQDRADGAKAHGRTAAHQAKRKEI
ncbi:enoyl-CoA hydratase/isomerase family protein [Segniliparus rugosus]|uniref:Enoyl-CoA hydratase/carnithine racemase n=1 Tax=Segniliparus rugosus (strain ATCC BAA-974 / DSM 45345 / CCUG 50838 / CIP 108380 / JCM 13579 / CDC 945) TaxID=679197 RepID=U1M1Z5_SEGRC|nr:enoyl-CoA hydratase/isomerase family protein [Segniliparus rugosus]ERG69115.1 hypothetical protein HMPREF9336_04259 [Segniliparus rugosus ATCC BAA-974]